MMVFSVTVLGIISFSLTRKYKSITEENDAYHRSIEPIPDEEENAQLPEYDSENSDDMSVINDEEYSEYADDEGMFDQDDESGVSPEDIESGINPVYEDGQLISLDPNWEFADFSEINTGSAVFYSARQNRNGIIVSVNAGHGTEGGSSVKTYCHPDKTEKVTGGSTAAGSIMATAVSGGMTFNDGTGEAAVTLEMAQILKDKLLDEGYDVLMIRDADDVQLDNVARTVISNNIADCHIALHWDGDSQSTDKGCFYISVPDQLKSMYPVSEVWQKSESLGQALVDGLENQNLTIYNGGSMEVDLTQTSYSTIPSVDMELGNQCSDHSKENLEVIGDGLVEGVNSYFGLNQ